MIPDFRHGDRWAALLGGDPHDLKRVLADLLDNGRVPAGAPAATEASFALAWPPDAEIRALGLLRRDPTTGDISLADAFPAIFAGCPAPARIERIDALPDSPQAILTLRLSPTFKLSVFDPHYSWRSAAYRRGDEMRFCLGGLAYRLGTTPPAPERLTDAAAIRAVLGLADDDEAPVAVDLSFENALIVAPLPGGGADDVRFAGRIEAVKRIPWRRKTLYKIRVAVASTGHGSTAVDLYLAETAWEGVGIPTIGAHVFGTAWLQGFFWPTP